MKFNWGYKILLVYAIFVGGIMFMVFLSSRESKDLVTENYYAEELKYQKVIDQSSNTASLSSPIEVIQEDDHLNLVFPNEFADASVGGNWLLYFAADIKQDHTGTFQLSKGKASIQLPQSIKGFYKLKLTWNAMGKDYYFEKDITFQ